MSNRRIKKVLPTVYDESLSYYEVLNKLTKEIDDLAEQVEVVLPIIEDVEALLASKQDTLVSGVNIKSINHSSILGAGNINLQVPLVSGTNIKTVNSNSLLGEGDLEVQEKLVSGTNIKTINSNSMLGDGNIAVQEPLVSGDNIKTVNNNSLVGSGNVEVQEPLVSGTNIKTVNSNSLLGSGDIEVQEKLVSATNIKTINGYSLLGSGNLIIGGGGGGGGTDNYEDLNNKPQINSHDLIGNQSSSDLGLQDELVSGTNIKTVNNNSLLGSGNVAVQETLVSGTNIKTINGQSVLGSGDIEISGGSHLYQHNIVMYEGDRIENEYDYKISFTILSTSSTAITISTLPNILGTTSGTRKNYPASGMWAHNDVYYVVTHIRGVDGTGFELYGNEITYSTPMTVNERAYDYDDASISDSVVTIW